MKPSVAAALFFFGCVPQARSEEDSRRLFVRDVSVAVADCVRRGAPKTCSKADQLAAAYYSKRFP